MSKRLSVLAKYGVPFLLAKVGYFLCRNSDSSFNASSIDLLFIISCCDLFTTPMIPSLTGITRPQSISMASVPVFDKINNKYHQYYAQ